MLKWHYDLPAKLIEKIRKLPQMVKVFAVRNNPPKFKEITPALLEEDIDYFLKDGEEAQLYHWPRGSRIIVL